MVTDDSEIFRLDNFESEGDATAFTITIYSKLISVQCSSCHTLLTVQILLFIQKTYVYIYIYIFLPEFTSTLMGSYVLCLEASVAAQINKISSGKQPFPGLKVLLRFRV